MIGLTRYATIRVLREFHNEARPGDNLKLSHWKPAVPIEVHDRMDVDGADEQRADLDDPSVRRKDEFHAAKFNIMPAITQYTEEQYNTHLQAHGWTKHETDYLFSLCEEFGLRWIVIGDRYEYAPPPYQSGDGRSNAEAPLPTPRTTEELKARYYNISAKIWALTQPPSTMDEKEFDLYERMSKFDAAKESQRKSLAEKLYLRTLDEAEEEKLLLAELKRIVANEEKFLAQRRELYSRIEYPVSNGNTALYTSSSGLSQLLQSLLQADKSKKRRSLHGPGADPTNGSSPAPTNANRDATAETPTAGNKRSSIANAPVGPVIRQLSQEEEIRYAVTRHERLQPGPYFRGERNSRVIGSKAMAVREKITASMRELGIPLTLVMPTTKNCHKFEDLVSEIVTLVEVRRVKEKTESEFRVLEAQRRIRLGLPPQEEQEKPQETPGQEQDGDSLDVGVKAEVNGHIKMEPNTQDDEGADEEQIGQETAGEDGIEGDAEEEEERAEGNREEDEDRDPEEQDDDDEQDDEVNDTGAGAEAEVNEENSSDEEFEGLGDDQAEPEADAEREQEEEGEEQASEEDDDPEEEEEEEEVQGSDEDAPDEDASDNAEEEEVEDAEDAAQEDEPDAEPVARVKEVQAQAHKRSASVLSATSNRSERKRARK